MSHHTLINASKQPYCLLLDWIIWLAFWKDLSWWLILNKIWRNILEAVVGCIYYVCVYVLEPQGKFYLLYLLLLYVEDKSLWLPLKICMYLMKCPLHILECLFDVTTVSFILGLLNSDKLWYLSYCLKQVFVGSIFMFS